MMTPKVASLILIVLVLIGALLGTVSVNTPAQVIGPSAWIVVDGDTIKSPAGVSYRIEGLDTPETHQAKCDDELAMGLRAKRRLEQLMASGHVSVIERTTRTGKARRDKYGRTIARVEVNGEDVARIMVGEGLARVYAGGKRKAWC